MKKISSIIVSLVLIFSLNVSSSAATIKQPNNLAPYQAVISKLNKEFGASIKIPDEQTLTRFGFKKDEVYKNICNTPLDKFETDLRTEYKKIKNPQEGNVIYINVDDTITKNQEGNQGTRVSVPPVSTSSATDNNNRVSTGASDKKVSNYNLSEIISPDSIRQDLLQKVWLTDGYGAVDLQSVVFSGTGIPGSYSYTQIVDLGYYVFTDRTHFRAVSGTSYEIFNGNRYCNGTYKGSLFTASGVQLIGMRTYTITYNAG